MHAEEIERYARVPRLATDEEAEALLDADLSDLDFSQFKRGRLRVEERPVQREASGRSEAYRLFEQAMIEEKQIVCVYKGRHRQVCPIILGHKEGKERALTYQFAGGSTSGALPPGGEWRCLDLSQVSEVQLRAGQWASGTSHTRASHCIDAVDLDVNPHSPYRPKRSLLQLRAERVAPSAP